MFADLKTGMTRTCIRGGEKRLATDQGGNSSSTDSPWR